MVSNWPLNKLSLNSSISALSAWHSSDDIRVTRVSDGQSAYTEIFAASCPKLVIIPRVVVNPSFSQHCVILYLRLAQGWGIVSNDNKLALSIPEGLQSLLVPQTVLARLHDQGKPGIDGFIGLLYFLSSNHFDFLRRICDQYLLFPRRRGIQLVTTLVEVNQAILAW